MPGSNIPIINLKSGKHRNHKIQDVAFWKRIHKLDLFVDPLVTPSVIDFTTGKSVGQTGMLTMGAFRTKWVSATRLNLASSLKGSLHHPRVRLLLSH